MFGVWWVGVECVVLQGPSSLAFDSKGSLYFTDSGPLGETSLSSPLGSCFVISAKGQILRPLARHSLAHPCGIAVTPDGNIVCVCGVCAEVAVVSPCQGRALLAPPPPPPGVLFGVRVLWSTIGVAVLCCWPVLCCGGGPRYVAEMMANRVLRFVQRPAGVFHSSVFYQFSGRMGPSALCCDSEGTLYVARYDFAGV